MRIARILNNDLANGPGIRTSVFVSGCPLHCPGCHNPELQNFDVGVPFSDEIVEKVIASLNKDGIKRNLSILGGEPLAERNIDGVLELCQKVKEAIPETEIWVWTGYDFIERFQYSPEGSLLEKNFYGILNTIDVVVDGPFIQSMKPGDHPWRGSSNQRILYLHH